MTMPTSQRWGLLWLLAHVALVSIALGLRVVEDRAHFDPRISDFVWGAGTAVAESEATLLGLGIALSTATRINRLVWFVAGSAAIEFFLSFVTNGERLMFMPTQSAAGTILLVLIARPQMIVPTRSSDSHVGSIIPRPPVWVDAVATGIGLGLFSLGLLLGFRRGIFDYFFANRFLQKQLSAVALFTLQGFHLVLFALARDRARIRPVRMLLISVVFGVFVSDALCHINWGRLNLGMVPVIVLVHMFVILGSLVPIGRRGFNLALSATDCRAFLQAWAEAAWNRSTSLIRRRLRVSEPAESNRGTGSLANRSDQADQAVERNPSSLEFVQSPEGLPAHPRAGFRLWSAMGWIALMGLFFGCVRALGVGYAWYLATDSLIGLGAVCGAAFSVTRRFGPRIRGRLLGSALRIVIGVVLVLCAYVAWAHHRCRYHIVELYENWPCPDTVINVLAQWYDARHPVKPGHFKIHGEYPRVDFLLGNVALVLFAILGMFVGIITSGVTNRMTRREPCESSRRDS